MGRRRVWLGFFAATCAVFFAAWVGTRALRRHWVARHSPIERLDPDGFTLHVVDIFDRPIAGARVAIGRRASIGVPSLDWAATVTDGEGRVLIHLHGAFGAFGVWVVPAGSALRYDAAGGGAIPEISGPMGRRPAEIVRVVVDPFMRPLRARVVDERGAPVARADVVIRRGDGFPAEGELRLETDAEGRFSAPRVPSGRYQVLVTGHSPERVREVRLQAGETSTVIVLPDVTTLSGTLSGFQTDAIVQIVAEDAPARRLLVSGSDFAVANVPRGEVIVGVIAGSTVDIETLRVDPPAPATIRLAPRPAAHIEVLVTDGVESRFWVPSCAAFLSRPTGSVGPVPLRRAARNAFVFEFDAPIGESVDVECDYGEDQRGHARLDDVRAAPMRPLVVELRPRY